jgi:hypothetical protein
MKVLFLKNLIFVIALCIFLAVISTCKKDNSYRHFIKILNDSINLSIIYVRDTLKIDYDVDEDDLKSIYLVVDDSINNVQTTPLYYFNFIPGSTGTYKVKLIANYFTRSTVESEMIWIFVNPLNLQLRLKCNRIDGNKYYFVGEEISIEVQPKYDWMIIDNLKKIQLFLNGYDLGIKTSPPFVFETPEIQSSDNLVYIELIDSANHFHQINMELYVPENTPPEIELSFKHSNVIMSGYYYSTDDVILSIEGSDNVYVDYVDFYFENQYVATDSVKSDFFFGREQNLGALEAGIYQMYCIAYDDRGVPTTSETIECLVYTAFDINDDIVDIETTPDPSLVYLISSTNLYRLDPISENIIEIINLPGSNANTVDYVNEQQKLFIGFDDGQLTAWDEVQHQLIPYPTSGIDNIKDIEIDNELNKAILISNYQVIQLNLSDGSFTAGSVALYDGSTLIYNSTTKNIIAGGRPGASIGNVYKLKLENDSLITINSASIGGYAAKLIQHPNKNQFLIQIFHTVYCLGYSLYSGDEFGQFLGQYETYQPQCATFSTIGNQIFLGNNWDSEIVVFNTDSYSELKTKYIPLGSYNDINHMTTNANDSKLILTTHNVFYDDVKVIFVRLDE